MSGFRVTANPAGCIVDFFDPRTGQWVRLPIRSVDVTTGPPLAPSPGPVAPSSSERDRGYDELFEASGGPAS